MRHEFRMYVSYEANGQETYTALREAVQQAAREVLTTALLLNGKRPSVTVYFDSNSSGMVKLPLSGDTELEQV